ncbi:YceI family protein [Pedobacter sp. MR2016-24]|uniref:YceI family protein n=1 Tax=Pedobacter sp. MR2016-24 TaxID=2994466 RepID=UPI002247865B|nr:YceI family protein [Pedobacter sp. MR2016-24]MCX2486198.1 YceI family protein [Pedobacter sp. MR2016-24]
MKRMILLFGLCLSFMAAGAQNIFVSKATSITFFSSTPVEDIEGKSTTASSVVDIKSRNIVFKVSNTSFQFKKKLMQEHFNENYIESDKYPFSIFRGKITDDVDLSKDGSYTVNVEGTLDIHGVTKAYQSKANIVVAKGVITARTTIRVKIEDHQIKVPSIVFKNIAEFVDVRISATYQPKKS